jgi:hypothetical protein
MYSQHEHETETLHLDIQALMLAFVMLSDHPVRTNLRISCFLQGT